MTVKLLGLRLLEIALELPETCFNSFQRYQRRKKKVMCEIDFKKQFMGKKQKCVFSVISLTNPCISL